LQSWYMLAWGLLVLISGMFGGYAIIGCVFMTTTYVLAVTTSNLEQNLPLDLKYSLSAIAGVFIAGFLSRLIWKTKFAKAENQKLAQLSSILANKDQQAEILVESIADGIVLINTQGKISL